MSTIKILTSIAYDRWEDISVYVANDVSTQDRIDQAFGVGSTNCWINRSKNIPPYTLININDTIYCGYSSCNRYVQNNSYYLHKLSILPLEAYLSGFLIGTKSFSTTGTHTTDREKIEIIFEIISDKYGITISMGTSPTLLTKSKEYQYGAGSTAWDIISDICKNNNVRPRLTYDVSTKKYTFIEEAVTKELKSLFSDYLSNAEYTQSMDDYCKYLETEASNVVDRTTLTHVRDLTCRSEDPVLTSDNGKLILPSKIESIVDFGVTNFKRTCWWFIKKFLIYTQYGAAYSAGEFTGTIGELIDNGRNPLLTTLYNSYFYQFYSLALFRACVVTYQNNSTYGLGLLHTNGLKDGNTSVCYTTLSLSNYILPREKWDLLTDQKKTSYAYYDHGSDTIENMNATYKDDLFNILLGNSGTPLLEQTFPEIDSTTTVEGYDVVMNILQSKPVESTTEEPHSTDPVDFSWFVDYYAICDPRITSTKTISVIGNEDSWKPIGRSYNNGSSYIDFDKLITSLTSSNNMIGDAELTLEFTIPESFTKRFYAGDMVNYDTVGTSNITWYVSSAITRNYIDYKTITLNLVRSYSKVAECIGVDTQYNATKNPLNSIITRPIEFDGSLTSTFDESKNYYFRFQFYKMSGGIQATLFKPAVVMKDLNGNMLFYCEADSQYSFATRVGSNGSSSGFVKSWYQSDIAYCESNAECYQVSAQIVTLPYVDYDMSKKMPNYTGTYTAISKAVKRTVYKDARERLTFTYVVNN